MEQTKQIFAPAILAIPALLALIPAFLFFAGRRLAARERFTVAGNPLYWLGAHGITLVLANLLYVLRGAGLPDAALAQLPLVFTLAYLLLAGLSRSSFILSIALATPGLWLLCARFWMAVSGAGESIFLLPLEPFWYLLAAAALFALRRKSRLQRLWSDLEGIAVTMSGSYLMGGLWLLAIGQRSLLAGLGLAPHIWAAGLLAAGAGLLWCARLMGSAVLAGCGLAGLLAGLYAFVTRYPW